MRLTGAAGRLTGAAGRKAGVRLTAPQAGGTSGRSAGTHLARRLGCSAAGGLAVPVVAAVAVVFTAAAEVAEQALPGPDRRVGDPADRPDERVG